MSCPLKEFSPLTSEAAPREGDPGVGRGKAESIPGSVRRSISLPKSLDFGLLDP